MPAIFTICPLRGATVRYCLPLQLTQPRSHPEASPHTYSFCLPRDEVDDDDDDVGVRVCPSFRRLRASLLCLLFLRNDTKIGFRSEGRSRGRSLPPASFSWHYSWKRPICCMQGTRMLGTKILGHFPTKFLFPPFLSTRYQVDAATWDRKIFSARILETYEPRISLSPV